MSRVAKSPVFLPKGVEIAIEPESIRVKGPKGTLEQHYDKLASIKIDAEDPNKIVFEQATKHPKAWAHAGTARALVNNMIKGVTEGFSKGLELVGVGYRVQVAGSKINLSLGYSHPIEYNLPSGITAEAPTNTTLHIKGSDKQLVGQVSADIRALRKPEPYNGKGIKYVGENIARKEAKKK